MNVNGRNLMVLAVSLTAAFTSKATSAQSLDGVWEITQVIDDGRVINPTDVLLNYAADGRVIVKGQSVELVVPQTYQRKRLPYVVDATKNPMTFDMAGAERTGGRGIFLAGPDSLMLCLAARDRDRPTSFSSQPGSKNLFVTLKRSTGADPNTPAAQPLAAPTYQDEQLQRMLVGTWGHQDSDSIHYITLNSDGSFSGIMQWKDNFKQMFHQDVKSTGTWKVQDGVAIMSITQSTDPERRGQVGSIRVRSITPTELVAVDSYGQVRQEWKVQ